MNDIIQSILTLDPAWIYLVIFLVAYIENLFPPAPSDVLVVFGGALAAMGEGNVVVAFVAATLGGTFGFMTMYYVGKWIGKNILEQGKLSFISRDGLHKIEKWFEKYGFWLIISNRFLSGTRAVVSFFAGLSELDFKRTAILSFLSSSLWYAILVYAGYSVGTNWEKISELLKTYSLIVSIVILGLVILFLIHYFFIRKR